MKTTEKIDKPKGCKETHGWENISDRKKNKWEPKNTLINDQYFP